MNSKPRFFRAVFRKITSDLSLPKASSRATAIGGGALTCTLFCHESHSILTFAGLYLL